MTVTPIRPGRYTRRRLLATSAGAGIALGMAAAGRSVFAQDATATAESSEGIPVFTDLPYTTSGNPMHRLDLYLPEIEATAPLPLVIWIHGGGWIGGDKRMVGVNYLLEDGYAIASINYRLMQEALPPAQVQDANAAAAFLWKNADKYGLDVERFVLGGASAGGRSTGLAGLSANNDVSEFEASPDVHYAALLDFFGGTGTEAGGKRNRHRRRQNFHKITAAERREMLTLIDTLSYVDGDDPPTLIIHGDDDETVPVEESIELAAALESAGVPVQLERFPGRGHGVVNFQDEDARSVVRGFLTEFV